MKNGSSITIPDHILAGRGPRGERMRQPGLPGRWVIWSQVDTGPGHHAVTPADDDARATGAKWATVRITFAKDAAHPTVQLISTEPHAVMPNTVKHEESGAHR